MIREIVDDAIKVSEIAEFKLPKVSITGRNGVERDEGIINTTNPAG